MEKYLEIFNPIAQEMGIKIVDVETVGSDILDLSIVRLDYEPVDLELCALAATAFSEAIDYAVSLDVGSAGAERVIDAEDYGELVGQYVYIQFKNPVQNADYVEGDIVAVTDDNVTVSYRVKTAVKKVDIERLNIKMLRLAVRI